MNVRIPAVLLATLVFFSAGIQAQAPAGTQPAQRSDLPVRARSQFQGVTETRVNQQSRTVRVDIRLWDVAGGQRLNALELPFRGLVIAELRGGSVTTVIGGRRVERRAGEIWSVPAGTTMQLETGNDSATLQVTVIGN